MLNLFKKPAKYTVSSFECNRGQLTIRGTEYRPAGNNLPVVIASHGFMANQDTVKQYAIALAEMGYAAYTFDFCGGCVIKGNSDGATTDMSVLTEVEDLRQVVEYTQSLPYTDSDNITLLGCSQGGFVSAILAAQLKEKISKIVLFYPALCIPDDARAGKMMFAKFDPQNIPERINCGPMKLGRCYVADMVDKDPYEMISGCTANVLIIHGTDDKIVNIDYSRKALATYDKTLPRDKTVSLYVIESGAHGFSKKHDAQAIKVVKEFMKNP